MALIEFLLYAFVGTAILLWLVQTLGYFVEKAKWDRIHKAGTGLPKR